MKKENSLFAHNPFLGLDFCRQFLFTVSPFPSGDSEKDKKLEMLLTSFVRDIKMNETHTTIRFLCDDKGKVFKFFKDKQPFYVFSLDRTGNKVFSIKHCNNLKSNIYVEEFGHYKTGGILTGVVIIEREDQ